MLSLVLVKLIGFITGLVGSLWLSVFYDAENRRAVLNVAGLFLLLSEHTCTLSLPNYSDWLLKSELI